MLKRFLALLLCLILAGGIAACAAPAESENTDGVSTEGTDSGASATSGKEKDDPWEGTAFDPTAEHKFLATDIKNHSIVIFDLNRCKGDLTKLTERTCVIWEWDADKDKNCKIKPGSGVDAAKLRYSPYYKKDVIVACSSSGWAGVIDYKKKTVLWEYKIGNGPHSVEMMPNGDVVVAGSGGDGILAYVPLSAGVTAPSDRVVATSAHGVTWDPQNQCLWVLEASTVVCFTVDGEGTAEAKLVRHDDRSVSLVRKDSYGHVLSPVVGKPGVYWVAGTHKLQQFNSATGEVHQEFDYAIALTQKDIKGVASFSDGVVVQTAAGMGGGTTYDWSSKAIRIMIPKYQPDGTLRPINKDVVFRAREFYKVFPLTKDYQ